MTTQSSSLLIALSSRHFDSGELRFSDTSFHLARVAGGERVNLAKHWIEIEKRLLTDRQHEPFERRTALKLRYGPTHDHLIQPVTQRFTLNRNVPRGPSPSNHHLSLKAAIDFHRDPVFCLRRLRQPARERELNGAARFADEHEARFRVVSLV